MATTFVLKRKYFADPNQQDQEKKGMSTGKKVAIGAGLATAATAATALAAMRGAGNLTKANLSSFKKFGGAVKDTFGKGNFKQNVNLKNIGQGYKSLGQAGVKYAKQGVDKVKGAFTKGGAPASTTTPPATA